MQISRYWIKLGITKSFSCNKLMDKLNRSQNGKITETYKSYYYPRHYVLFLVVL